MRAHRDSADALLSDATTYTGLPARTVSYTYDPDGSRAGMGLTGVSGSFSYTYDNAGRLTGLTNPFSETTGWTYQDNDWLATQALPDGVTTAFTYDARGQETDRLTAAGGTTLSDFAAPASGGYDGAGNRLSLHVTMPAFGSSPDTGGTTSYAYDGRDELTGESSTRLGGSGGAASYSNAYAYDGVTSGTTTGPGNPTGMRGVSQGFDADNRLTGAGGGSGSGAFAYDGDGDPTTYQGAALSFDPEGRLSGLSPASAPAPAVADAGFEAPSVGTSAPGDYAYGPTGGSWAFASGGGIAGPGSAWGNPTAPEGSQVAFVQDTGAISQSLSGFQAGTEYAVTVSAAQRSYLGTNQQTVAVKLDGVTVGTVTPSGAAFADYTVGPFTASAGRHTLTLAGLDPPGGDNTTFLDNVRLSATSAAPSYGYNGDGLRASKNVGGTPTYFLYDGDTPLARMDGSGNVTAVETFGADGLAAQRTLTGTPASYFYTWDPSGSVAQRLSPTAGGQSYVFDGFGAQGLSPTGDPFTGFGGQWGGYTDPETGLALLTHRYYDAGTGRWLTRDPLGYKGGVNLYDYARNNPVNRHDPKGLWSITIGCSLTGVLGLPIGLGGSLSGGIVIGDGGVGLYGSVVVGLGIGVVGSAGLNVGYSGDPQPSGFHGGPIYGGGLTGDLGDGGSISFTGPFSGSDGPSGISGWKGGPGVGGGLGIYGGIGAGGTAVLPIPIPNPFQGSPGLPGGPSLPPAPGSLPSGGMPRFSL